MLTHPDPQTQAIFSMLEQQRDDAIIRAANAESQLGEANKKIVVLETAFQNITPAVASDSALEDSAAN